MAHAVFTIVTPVRPPGLAQLDRVLQTIAQDPGGNLLIPFATIPTLHFASFVVFERERDPFLVFEISADGDAATFLERLLAVAPEGVDAVYQNVEGYPTGGSASARLQFLLDSSVTPNLYHVGTPAMTARAIRCDRNLREALETDLDGLVQGPAASPPSSASLWRRLAEIAATPPSLTTEWVTEGDRSMLRWIPGPAPSRGERLRVWVVFALIILGIVSALAATFGALLGRGDAALTAAYVILAVIVAATSVVLSGWPSGRAHFSWPAVRLMLATGIVTFVAALLLRIPPVHARLTALTLTSPSGQAVWTSLLLAGLWLAATIATLALSETLFPVPTPEGQFSPLDPDARARILEAEDRDVQNHMSALVPIDPVWYRVLSLRIFLWLLLRLYYRTRLTKGKLVSIPTVHFAQWVLLDGGRFLFLSNYDHSWSRYLDDFGTRIGAGIIKIWGQGIGFPGIGNLASFKEYARSTMVPHAVWYSAYPGLTVRQIWTNRRVRTDLFSDPDEKEAADRLGRLAAAGPL